MAIVTIYFCWNLVHMNMLYEFEMLVSNCSTAR